MSAKEGSDQFETRKKDHIRWAVDPASQSQLGQGLDQVKLRHEAIPSFNFSRVSINSRILNVETQSPLFISSMTAGHEQSVLINERFCRAAVKFGWIMGLGSQRRELWDDDALKEWQKLRQDFPDVRWLSNIGITQLAEAGPERVERLASAIGALGLIVHTNPLQEAIQPEGTPHFANAERALLELAEHSNLPVILKETGCGFSRATLQRLSKSKLKAVDVAGRGGTNWGRVEGLRLSQNEPGAWSSEVFREWGTSTTESLKLACETLPKGIEVWASGGVRSGLDALKCLALGAQAVGIASPLMAAAIESQEKLEQIMTELDHQVRLGLFLTGCENLETFRKEKPWTIQKVESV